MKRPALLQVFISIAFLQIAKHTFSQDLELASRSVFDYTPSMQTWSFIKYGNVPVDYYTGNVQVNVPIYEYKDNDFDISISAGYASNGFQPLRQTGILGMNWFLNCGGAVTREIRGVADDVYIQTDMRGDVCGFLRSDNYDDTSTLNDLGGKVNYNGFGYLIDSQETEADYFHFNFGGHSGSFHYNGHREICVYNTGGNNGTYKIECGKFNNAKIMNFTITTGDGYVYYFGDDDISTMNGVEELISGNFTTPGIYEIANDGSDSDRITVTWFLKKITAPNGRSVIFEYDSFRGYESNFMNKTTSNPYYVTSFILDRNDYGISEMQYHHWRKVSILKTSYLSRIKIINGGNSSNDLIVDFAYSKKKCRDASFSTNDIAKEDAGIVQYLKQLDSIVVHRGDAESLCNCNFEYRIKDERLMLDAIAVSGVGGI